jgi:hypothetical protein
MTKVKIDTKKINLILIGYLLKKYGIMNRIELEWQLGGMVWQRY